MVWHEITVYTDYHPNSAQLLQAVMFATECPDNATCSVMLDLVVSGARDRFGNGASSAALAYGAQCAFGSSLFQVMTSCGPGMLHDSRIYMVATPAYTI